MNGLIQVPLWIFISQWILLFALGAFVITAYRQLGYILHLHDFMETAGSERDSLALGAHAVGFHYTLTKEAGNRDQSFEPQGMPSLLLFVDPGCMSCQNALRALERLAPQFRNKIRFLVITSSEPTFLEASEAFRSTSLEVGRVKKEVIYQQYQTNITPFLYLIDQNRVIRAKGGVDGESSIKKIIRRTDFSQGHSPLVMSKFTS